MTVTSSKHICAEPSGFADIAEGLRGSPLRHGSARRAPGLVRFPVGWLAEAIERCELAALFWAGRSLASRRGPARWRDPDCRKLSRTLSRWLRLEALLGRVKDYNWRVAKKRAVIADACARAELRAALGGDAAMARWERAWAAREAAERAKGECQAAAIETDARSPAARAGDTEDVRPYLVVEGGCGLRGCDCVKCGGEFVGYDFGYGAEGSAEITSASVVPGAGGNHYDKLRATFRLASVPRGAGRRDAESRLERSARDVRSLGPRFRGDDRVKKGRREAGRARLVRIPVWPSELEDGQSRGPRVQYDSDSRRGLRRRCGKSEERQTVFRPPFADSAAWWRSVGAELTVAGAAIGVRKPP